MEKQHNRGQDGVGLANIKLDVEMVKILVENVLYHQTYTRYLDKLVKIC